MKAETAEVMIKRTEITIETVSVTRIRRASSNVSANDHQPGEPAWSLPETTSAEEQREETE
jgi:hypothetical protein